MDARVVPVRLAWTRVAAALSALAAGRVAVYRALTSSLGKDRLVPEVVAASHVAVLGVVLVAVLRAMKWTAMLHIYGKAKQSYRRRCR